MRTEPIRTAGTPVLEITYEQVGDPAGTPVVLLHGFPYDVRSYDDVASVVADAGARVILPYLRGYGPTRFLRDDTMRSGQQGALGQDLIDLLDTLDIESAVVGGYDWGGRAACIAAALWPERIRGLVTVGGYNIQDIAKATPPQPRDFEPGQWYQYYLYTERGREGLSRYREEFALRLWQLWSPTWTDAAHAFTASAPSLHNPDFVDVVVHSYRHRRGLAAGDSRYDGLEAQLAARPAITVPTIALDALADGLGGPDDSSEDRPLFTDGFDIRAVPDAGHDLPQEAPDAFARAVLDLL